MLMAGVISPWQKPMIIGCLCYFYALKNCNLNRRASIRSKVWRIAGSIMKK